MTIDKTNEKKTSIEANGFPGGATFANPVHDLLIETDVISKYHW